MIKIVNFSYARNHPRYRYIPIITLDVIAPLYWWRCFKTINYNKGRYCVERPDREFTLDDFSCEHLLNSDTVGKMEDADPDYIEECLLFMDELHPEGSELPIDLNTRVFPLDILKNTIKMLNVCREQYIATGDKRYWWQIVNLLPSNYNQKRTIELTLDDINFIYCKFKDDPMDEWREFCKWFEQYPYNKLIIGGNEDE